MKTTHLDKFGLEVFTVQDVNGFQVKVNAQHSPQQQDRPTRWTGRQVVEHWWHRLAPEEQTMEKLLNDCLGAGIGRIGISRRGLHANAN